MRASFVVENAGCPSCGERVRAALTGPLVVETLEIDEGADTASVSVAADDEVNEGAVEALLADASAGSGHAYRVRPGSFHAV